MQQLSNWKSDSAQVYNDIWGYAANGREYAIVGSNWGTHFVDITNPAVPTEIAAYAGAGQAVTGYNSSWRDFKTYGHYVYGVADVGAHTLQIFDMSQAPDTVFKVYDSNALSTSAHTVAQENDRLYLVANRRDGAFWPIDIVSVSDPLNPTLIGTIGAPWFTEMHALHVRNDTLYCSAGYSGLYIIDATNAAAPSIVSTITNYPSSGYNHTAWTSGDRKTMIMTDEVPASLPVKVFDISDISNPTLLTTFDNGTLGTPHNTFMIGDIAILSYYMDGVQVYDLQNPSNPVRIGYFDTFPDNDSTQTSYTSPTPYNGNWGVYPYLPSGNIIASDKVYGLYVISPPYTITAAQKPDMLGIKAQVYPNPAEGNFTVKLAEVTPDTELTLYNSLGVQVYNAKAAGTENRIVTSQLSAGLYTLRISNKTQSAVQKVVLR